MILDQEKEFIAKDEPPVRYVEVEDQNIGMPQWFSDRISIDVIHDGPYIPQKFLVNENGETFDLETIQHHYVVERDWGANFVAGRVASRLGVPGYLTVQTDS